MVFTGNTAPYHITQPPIDNDVQIVSPTATMANLTCSLNDTIPSSVIVSWMHNSTNPIPRNATTQADNTTTLLIETLQPSDAGVYQCVFSDITISNRWSLSRNIRLLIVGMM